MRSPESFRAAGAAGTVSVADPPRRNSHKSPMNSRRGHSWGHFPEMIFYLLDYTLVTWRYDSLSLSLCLHALFFRKDSLPPSLTMPTPL
jgi:hypothetical protein